MKYEQLEFDLGLEIPAAKEPAQEAVSKYVTGFAVVFDEHGETTLITDPAQGAVALVMSQRTAHDWELNNAVRDLGEYLLSRRIARTVASMINN